MRMFGATVGKQAVKISTDPAKAMRSNCKGQDLFGAAVGKRPSDAIGEAAQHGESPLLPLCPLCRQRLDWDDGLIRCTNRCGGVWVLDRQGHLRDTAALPYGVCDCCRPREMLVATDQTIQCPRRQTTYVLSSLGKIQQLDDTTYGMCRCCIPPQPLYLLDNRLICPRQPTKPYYINDDAPLWQVKTGQEEVTDTLQKIDAALVANSAIVGLHGLFEIT